MADNYPYDSHYVGDGDLLVGVDIGVFPEEHLVGIAADDVDGQHDI